jgi:hypothetical protein
VTQSAVDIGRPWPPVYDDESLAEALKLAVAGIPKQFYLPDIGDGIPCQGDILALSAEVPVLDEDGDASIDGAASYWLVAANTCDVSRAFEDNADVLYVSIVPLIAEAELVFQSNAQRDLHAYRLSRLFHVPPWEDRVAPQVADFTRFTPIHREALKLHATVRARMCFESWIVLNACLVRLLCRQDGRYMP